MAENEGKDPQDARDEMWERGNRAAWVGLLEYCLRQLGYKSEEGAKVAWISERERAVGMLRQVCEIHGDNDWPDELHLADVIEKHLWDSLEEARK